MILLDLKALPFVPLNNLPRQLVHCELGQSVLLTMVDGQRDRPVMALWRGTDAACYAA